jgi:Domain of unknown function (DUF4136)
MRMSRKIKLLLFVLCVTVCLPALATAQNVIYNYAQGVDFSLYKTYEWVDIKGVSAGDQNLDSEIKQAIDLQLAARGLAKVKQGGQLYVAYQVSFPREKQIGQYIRGGYGARGPGWGYGCIYGDIYGPTMSVENNSTIPFGNLVLDVYDSAFKELLWRGTVSNSFTPDPKRHMLDKAAAKLLKKFPPKTKN